MTNEEKDRAAIEAAAKDSAEIECLGIDSRFPIAHKSAFKAGVTWRDENPSPQVMALVSALEKIAQYHSHEPAIQAVFDISRHALEAFKVSINRVP